MRRLLRRAFNLCAVVSAVLLVGVCVLWVRSYRAASAAGLMGVAEADGLRHDYYFCSDRGRITYLWFHQPNGPSPGWRAYDFQSGFASPAARGVSFGYSVTGSPYPFGWHELTAPHWSVGLPLAAIAVLALRSASRRRTRRPGHCPACGYDLRATPGRCPECGAVPKQA